MARIPGVRRSSASPSLENKEENERDVALNHQDPDRWGKNWWQGRWAQALSLRREEGGAWG